MTKDVLRTEHDKPGIVTSELFGVLDNLKLYWYIFRLFSH